MILINKKAKFNYFFEDTFIAGISLLGSEVKSIRKNNVSFNDAFCYFPNDNTIFVKNLHIAEYKEATLQNHDPLRERQLLLNKKELKKIKKGIERQGYTLIPIELFINKAGFIKLKIALAKGKKQYDKRETIKERDLERYE